MRHGQTDIGEIGGRWSHVMDFRSTKVIPPIHQASAEANTLVHRPVRGGCCSTWQGMERSSPRRV